MSKFKVMFLLFVYVFVLLQLTQIKCFSTNLIRDQCHRKMEINEIMMGKPIEFDNQHNIQVFHEGNLLSNNSMISSNAQLVVKMEPKIFQMVFEISHAEFIDGFCLDSKRSNRNGVEINLLKSHGEVIITGVWAKSYATGVKITDSFHLTVNNENDL